jgi:hypothetical protein
MGAKTIFRQSFDRMCLRKHYLQENLKGIKEYALTKYLCLNMVNAYRYNLFLIKRLTVNIKFFLP